MAPGKQYLQTACLALVLLGGLVFIGLSFHPRVRFADPAPGGGTFEDRTRFPCIYQTIYDNSQALDVLYFGASKSNIAADAELIGDAFEAVTGEELEVFTFTTPFSNAELTYFFFRDYLARNPAPRQAYFELTANFPHLSAVKYAHAYFPDLAPPYMYLDVVHPGIAANNRVFGLADSLRLLVRHVDLALARLLRSDARFIVPPGDHCRSLPPEAPVPAIDNPEGYSFARLLDAEMNKLLPPIDPETVGTKPALLDAYADNDIVTRHVNAWNDKRRKRLGTRFWRGPEQIRDRNLDYYRRAVALGKANGVDVAFFYLPNILEPKPHDESVERLSRRLGAEIHTLPYWYARISYHHSLDGAHAAPEIRPAFAIWFASLIEQGGKD